jgi:hypothetical protein
LRSFFKSFFKRNDAVKLYGLLQKRLESKRPGDRLWQNEDIRIDRGETLADGSTNVVWQRQAQTKHLILKTFGSHSKIVTQRIFVNDEAGKLVQDIFRKLG